MQLDACKKAHAELIAGKCPWCGNFIREGLTEEQWQTFRHKLEELLAHKNKRKPLMEFRLVGELKRMGLPVSLQMVMRWLKQDEI